MGYINYGVVANPKTHELRLTSIDSVEPYVVHIRDVDEKWIGSGYFDDGTYKSPFAPAIETRMPRVHTVDGVVTKGKGDGTCLYGSLAQAVEAFLKGWRVGIPNISYMNSGISSGHDRSRDADSWWDRASKIGLAEEFSYDTETQYQTKYKITLEAREVVEWLKKSRPGPNSPGIRRISYGVDSPLSFEMPVRFREIVTARGNSCSYDRMFSHGISCMIFSHKVDTADPFDVMDFAEVNVRSLYAIDAGVYGVHPSGLSVFKLIWNAMMFAKRKGHISYEKMQDVADRFDLGIDVRETRRIMGNPSDGKHGKTSAIYSSDKKFVAVFYKEGKAKKNPMVSESRVRELVDELVKARKSLGWDRMKDLP